MYSQKAVLEFLACQAYLLSICAFQPPLLRPVLKTDSRCTTYHIGAENGCRETVFYASKNKGIFDNINNLLGNKEESSDDAGTPESAATKAKTSPAKNLMDQYEKSPKYILQKGLASMSRKKADPIQAPPPALIPPPTPSSTKEIDFIPSKLKDDLNSKNPLKRLKAKIEVATEEKKREMRMARNKRIEQINSVKESFFEARDSAQRTYETVVNIPSEIEKSIRETQDTVKEISEKTKKTIEEVQKTPQKVQKAVDDTKKKIEDTQQATMDVVNEVKAIPGKIEKKVSDTKKSIDDTKKGTEELVSKVGNFVKSFDSKKESPATTNENKPPSTSSSKPASISEIDPGLGMEVNEALNVAKEALKDTNTKPR